MDYTDYKTIFQSIPDLYLVLNPQFEIVEVSEAYLRATMVKRDDILGRNLFDVFPENPSDLKATGASNLRYSLDNVLKSKKSDTMAVQKYDIRRPFTKGGEYEVRYWSPKNSPVLDKNNEVKFIIHRVEDVTEFIRLKHLGTKQTTLNEEFKTRSKQMEAEIFQRAQEIQTANRELREAKELAENYAKKAEETTRIKNEFLANMSHELRTPLNGIIGFADLMYQGKVGTLTPEHYEYIGIILSSSQHLLQLINDILDLAKVESGKLEFHPQVVNTEQILLEMQNVLRTLLTEKQINFEYTIDPVIKKIKIDPGKLKQIFYNYISNAIKFSPQRGNIKVRLIPNEHNLFRLEVQDEGIGISERDISKLFVEFQQLDAGTNKKYPGTGLGLALTRRIVEAQGGFVGVSSNINKGSVFYAVLPRTPVAINQPPETKNIEPVQPAIISIQKILIIDDDVHALKLAKLTLAKQGFEVVCKTDASSGLLYIQQERPDLIILDLLMPNTNGFEFLHQFRLSDLDQTIPIIIWTEKDLNYADLTLLKNSVRAIVQKGPDSTNVLLDELLQITHKVHNESI